MESAEISSPTTSRIRAKQDEEKEDDLARDKKRIKLDHETNESEESGPSNPLQSADEGATETPKYDTHDLLPPSLKILGVEAPTATQDGARVTREVDVGISEYVGSDVPRIEGIIKQRFTDFLVFEVDTQEQVVHLTSIGKPHANAGILVKERAIPSQEPNAAEAADPGPSEASEQATTTTDEPPNPTVDTPTPVNEKPTKDNPWPASFTEKLGPLLSTEAIERLKEIYLQGPEPPLVSDSGWAGRKPTAEGTDQPAAADPPPAEASTSDRGRGRGRGRGERGKRGGRGAGRGGGSRREDPRKVVSEPFTSKEERTRLHQTIRELFQGKLETQASETAGEEGARIVIKWLHGGGRGGRDRPREPRPDRPPVLQYIHFTLQKTNRDTQDALGHLSRLLGVNVRDFAVAGTKDKRGVTAQRASMKRNGKTLEQFWKAANGVGSRRNEEGALSARGERGVRVGNVEWGSYSFKLGMLKGNAFVITLRNVKTDSVDTLNRAMETVKTKGFINYYGMQRFGTSSIPTHSIGLAILRSDWDLAISLILRPRPGEFPEAEAGRRAWLEGGDLAKALELIPRRCVAERSVLEFFKKKDKTGTKTYLALSTIPMNLRLMYVHAYQSYVWNAIVSERIRIHGCDKAVVGDIVHDKSADYSRPSEAAVPSADMADDIILDGDTVAEPMVTQDELEPPPSSGENQGKSKSKWKPPKLRVLSEADVDKYTIFDVIMPLPGRDVTYPGGSLGDRYREFLKADGLDPDNLEHNHRDYSLFGSYRHILHLPKELSWSIMRYTDPDVALAQSDEDKILGFDPPVTNAGDTSDGKFVALQMNLILGTSSYATMAIREVTKTETSAYHQAILTQASEDQVYKGSSGEAAAIDPIVSLEGDVGEDASGAEILDVEMKME